MRRAKTYLEYVAEELIFELGPDLSGSDIAEARPQLEDAEVDEVQHLIESANIEVMFP